MSTLSCRGKFITIDGPNGVGKTTLVDIICQRLKALSQNVLQTREPTKNFNRANEEKHREALARLIVEDRRHHLSDEVDPALNKGLIVISDRYIESSLVYRKLDGISFEETWHDNAMFLVPHISILLLAPAIILQERLRSKKTLTRFEREHASAEELALYHEAHSFLSDRCFETVCVENDTASKEDVAEHIIKLILQIV